MVNKVTLIGRLGADPETKTITANGTDISVCNFNLATSETFKKGDEKKELVEWHKIVAFRKLAEICSKYLKKGSLIYVEGKLVTDKYQDKTHQDVTHYSTKIYIREMRMISTGSKHESSGDNINIENAELISGKDNGDDMPF